MRIAYLEGFSGISGDMFQGALVDAGVPPEILQETVAALNIGARLEVSRVTRSGISATKVDVWVGDEKDLPREEYWSRQSAAQQATAEHASSQKHSQSHTHDHPRSHDHSTHPEHRNGNHEHGRGLNEIREIISAAAISRTAKETAIAVFEALGRAEAKIHNTSIDDIHFHEVGAVDAMVDIVCAAVGAEALAVDEIICSPLNVGGGTVKCAHGTFPVPAPATLELLADAPVYSSGVQAELVTPTGAAIVKTLVARFASFPQIRILKTGYGAGSRDFPGHPNVLRLTIGESTSNAVANNIDSDTVIVLEANLDDLTPQVFGYVIDRLMDEGALDAFATPIHMKKNRPGLLLTVLCAPESERKLSQLIFSETTTLGLRRREQGRQTLARRWQDVSTPWGTVRIKIASMNGAVTNYAPEYEDCRRIAAESGIPLKQVIQEAVRVYLATGGENAATPIRPAKVSQSAE